MSPRERERDRNEHDLQYGKGKEHKKGLRIAKRAVCACRRPKKGLAATTLLLLSRRTHVDLAARIVEAIVAIVN